MVVIAWVFWVLAALVTAAALGAVVVAATRPRAGWLVFAGLLPVVWAVLASVFDVVPAPPSAFPPRLCAVLVALIGVVGGGPFTTLVLRATTRGAGVPGRHGGILVRDPRPAAAGARVASSGAAPVGDDASTDDPRDDGVPPGQREILRGGEVIGYLERLAIIGCVLLGQFGGIAIVVAVKGLGRFNELVDEVARERFIIGTLASFIWAGAATAAILLVVA